MYVCVLCSIQGTKWCYSQLSVIFKLIPNVSGFALPQWNIQQHIHVYGLLTKREVHKHTEKELGQYPAILTEQAWSIKSQLSPLAGKNYCAETNKKLTG